MPQRRDPPGSSAAEPFRRPLEGARRVLTRWGPRNFASYPWRHERSRFHSLIAEVLLQRTRAEQVVKTFKDFKKRFPTPEDLGRATSGQVLRVTGRLGLRWRAPLLRRLGVQLGKLGEIPDELGVLVRLPGVGPYSAAAYLSFHRKRRGVLLDSNIVRFYGRLLGLPTGAETRRTRLFREIAEIATPVRNSRRYNYAVLDFTRGVCRPLPRCWECPLKHRCEFARGARKQLGRDRSPA